MKGINRITILFFLVVTILSIGVWEIIQSKYVGGYLSKQVSSFLEQNFDQSVGFESVRFKFFPPGVELQSIELELNNEKKNINGYVSIDRLVLSFNLFDVFRNRVSFSRASVEGGVAQVLIGENTDKEHKEKTFPKVMIFDLLQKTLPKYVSTINIQDFDWSVNGVSSIIYFSEFNFYKRSTAITLDLYKTTCTEDFCKSFETLDEISLRGRLSRNKLFLSQYKINHSLNSNKGQLTLEGDFSNYKKLSYKGFIESSINLADKHIVNLLSDRSSGLAKIKSDFSGVGTNYNFKSDISLENIYTKFVKIKSGSLGIEKIDDFLVANTINIGGADPKLSLLEQLPIYDFKKNKIPELNIRASANKLRTRQIFHFLNSTLDPLIADLSGELKLRLNLEKRFLNITSNNIKSDRLLVKVPSGSILDIDDVELSKSRFNINLDNGALYLESNLKKNETDIFVRGLISNGLDIKAEIKSLDFDDIGKIAELDFFGKATGQLNIKGPYNDVIFDISLNSNETKFLDLNLGEVKANLLLHLKEKFIDFRRASAQLRNSIFDVSGVVSFAKKTILDLSVKSSGYDYDDLIHLLNPITKDINYLPKNIDGVLSGGYKIWGVANKEDLKIIGKTNATEVVYQGEKFTELGTQFTYDKDFVGLSEFNFKKKTGTIAGKFLYGVKKKIFDTEFSFNKIRINDLDFVNKDYFALDGRFDGFAKFKGSAKRFDSNLSFKLYNSKIGNVLLGDSNIILNSSKDRLDVRFEALGGQVKFNSLINLSDFKKQSTLIGSVQSAQVKEILSIFFPHNLTNDSVFGDIDIDFNITTALDDFRKLNLNLMFNRFYFTADGVQLELDPSKNQLAVENGVVKQANLAFSSFENKLSVKVEGNVANKLNIKSSSELSAALAKIFSKNVLAVSGKTFSIASLEIARSFRDLKLLLSSAGEDIYVTYAGLPAQISNASYNITLKDKSLIIDSVKGKFGRGDFIASGSVQPDFPFPEVDVRFKFDNSRLNLFKKTSVWVSGKGVVSGSQIPYKVSGDISIINGNVNDELTDFNATQNVTFSNPFMPRIQSADKFSFFDTDIKVKTIRPLKIENSLAKMSLHTDLSVNGDLVDQKVQGDMRLVRGSGIFFFRNNDFVIREGLVSFDGFDSSKPFFDFEGISRIKQYDIILKISGTPDDYELDLSSNPALAREDILSLLALGITTSESSQLTEQEREAVTQLGIGALIFDRFKINQEMQSALGINFSLTPQVNDQDNEVLREIRDVNEGQSSGRARSGTRIQVKKKILKNKADISFSSTVGGEVNQRQEVNINYDINDMVSIEGVYELRDKNEEEIQQDSDSVGADVKFRIEF